MGFLAARYSAPGQVTIEEQSRLLPGDGEMIVRVERCGICGTDLHFYSGKWPPQPVIPGHELIGVIIECGAGSKGWSPGDRVLIEPVVGCGHCESCRSGHPNLCTQFTFLGVHRDGGMASLVAVPEQCLHRAPESINVLLGCLVEPLAVAMHAAAVGRVQAGQSVLILGAGTIGLLCIIAARERGAETIFSGARYPKQREVASLFGSNVLDPTADAQQPQEVDVVIDTVGGAGQALMQGLNAVKPGGTVVLVGGYTRPTSMHLARIVNREILIAGANCYDQTGVPTDFQRAVQTAVSGRYPLEALVTHTFSLREAPAAFAAAQDRAGGAIKVHLTP